MRENIGLFSKLKEIKDRIRGDIPTETLVNMGLVVGKNFSRQEKCSLDYSHCWLIEIGNNVTLGPRVHILAHDASMHNELGYTYIAPVTIGNNVFVGAGSIILPGVTIGDNVIIGAGSVVSRDIPSDSVAVGTPAHKIKSYHEFIEKHKQKMRELPNYGEEFTLRSTEFDDTKKKKMCRELQKKRGGYVI